jgi:hypothetical protein
MKQEIRFLVKGSAKEPYTVEFLKEDNNIKTKCSCSAGRYSTPCKHRISILTGNTMGIVSDNKDDVKKVVAWIENTEIASALDYYLEMKELEKNTKKEADKAKKLTKHNK